MSNLKHITTVSNPQHVKKVNDKHISIPSLHDPAALRAAHARFQTSGEQLCVVVEDWQIDDVFDYGLVDAAKAEKMYQAARLVREITHDAIVDVGKILRSIRMEVPHHQFVEWVERECQMPTQTVSRSADWQSGQLVLFAPRGFVGYGVVHDRDVPKEETSPRPRPPGTAYNRDQKGTHLHNGDVEEANVRS
jgi:hypothetical protein